MFPAFFNYNKQIMNAYYRKINKFLNNLAFIELCYRISGKTVKRN